MQTLTPERGAVTPGGRAVAQTVEHCDPVSASRAEVLQHRLHRQWTRGNIYDGNPVQGRSQRTPIARIKQSHSSSAADAPSTTPPPSSSLDTVLLSTAVPASVDWPLYRGQSLETGERMVEQCCFYAYSHRIDEPDVFEFWVPKGFYQDVLAIGFENPRLMHIVISLGGIARTTWEPQDPNLLATVHAYTARSITGQLAALKHGVTESNFDALYTTANLIACQTSLARAFAPRERSSLAGIVDWLRAWRGARGLLKLPAAPLAKRRLYCDPTSKRVDSDSLGILSKAPNSGRIFDFLLQCLPRMSTPYQTMAAYRDVVAFLDTINRKPGRIIHSEFLVDVSAIFVKDVARCEPTALLLMGAYHALTRILDPPFIADDAAEAELHLIQTFLPSMHATLLERAVIIIGDRESRKLQQQA